jgi:hypothetical protein
VLSNHFHLLLGADDAEKIANFMRDLQSKLAREVNRLAGWRGPVFERRYEMTVVTDEERAQDEPRQTCSLTAVLPAVRLPEAILTRSPTRLAGGVLEMFSNPENSRGGLTKGSSIG